MPNGRGSGWNQGPSPGGAGNYGYGNPNPPFGYGMPNAPYGYGQPPPPPPAYGYVMPPWGMPPAMSKEVEIDMLKGQAEYMQNALAEINERLKELENK